MYEVERQPSGQATAIRRLADSVCIPIDENNADYQRFIAWNEQQPEAERLSLESASPVLEHLKQLKRQALDAWLAAQEAAGYAPEGQLFVLRMSSADQAVFNLLDTGIQKLQAAGMATDADMVPIRAIDGRTYQVTVAEWQAISAGYAAACFALWSQYAAYSDLIEAAESAEALDAIVLE